MAKALLEGDFASYFASLPSADMEPEPIVLREGRFERASRMEAEERGTVTVAVMVVREVAATAEADAMSCERWTPHLRLGAGGGERQLAHRGAGHHGAGVQGDRRVRALRLGLRRCAYGGEEPMSDKGKRVNASGHQAEATVKRARPFGKDDRAARESQRRASAYGRARGNA